MPPDRLVAVLSWAGLGGAPPGVAQAAFGAALVEDTYEVVADMVGVRAVLAATPPDHAAAVEPLAWAGTPLLMVDADPPDGTTIAVLDALAAFASGAPAGASGAPPAALGSASGAAAAAPGLPAAAPGLPAAAPGASGAAPGVPDAALGSPASAPGGGSVEGVVVAGDAPDLPGLLVAKLFAAFTQAEVAVCPCEGGGLVALGCRLPVPTWLRGAGVGLGVPDALERLRAAAPRRGLVVGPGWRRLRAPADVGALDPGLEGWAATRALLGG